MCRSWLFSNYLKCECKLWKKLTIHLSSNINGVDDELPKLDLLGAERSSSRKHGNPHRYVNNCGPRRMLFSGKITWTFMDKGMNEGV